MKINGLAHLSRLLDFQYCFYIPLYFYELDCNPGHPAFPQSYYLCFNGLAKWPLRYRHAIFLLSGLVNNCIADGFFSS